MNEGKYIFTQVCSPARVSYVKRYLPRYYNLRQMQWYSTESSILDRYPKSIKPRICRLRDEDFQHLFPMNPDLK